MKIFKIIVLLLVIISVSACSKPQEVVVYYPSDNLSQGVVFDSLNQVGSTLEFTLLVDNDEDKLISYIISSLNLEFNIDGVSYAFGEMFENQFELNSNYKINVNTIQIDNIDYNVTSGQNNEILLTFYNLSDDINEDSQIDEITLTVDILGTQVILASQIE